jgi:cysteine desulfurase/selenocysteine lyase
MHIEFKLDPDLIYLNHAAVAPWPRRTCEAVTRFAHENASLGATRYLDWLKVEQRLRRRLAELINAPSMDDVALVKNTSEALSFIAHGLDWQAGDNIVSIAQEFPSNRIAWESLAGQGVELRLLDLDGAADPETELLALCDRNTRLISVSAVQYARGLLLDLEHIGAHCRRRNILFCVDAIQQIGALPFDVQAIGADFVAADGHKWMLGPEGLALFYVRENARDRLRLRQFGWHMVARPGDFDRTDWQPAADARRFECGSPNMLGIHALDASLSLIQELGMTRIAEAVARNVARCHELADRHGLEVLSPRAVKRRSGIFTFRVPGSNPTALYNALMQERVICAQRGGGIRFSPHFHTGQDDIERGFEVAMELAARQS